MYVYYYHYYYYIYIYICIYIYIYMYVCVCIYIYIYIYAPPVSSRYIDITHYTIPPVCCLRFVSDWTQPLDILSADSEFMCYRLSTKRCLGNPTLGTNLGQRNLAMRTGCSYIYTMIESTILKAGVVIL